MPLIIHISHRSWNKWAAKNWTFQFREEKIVRFIIIKSTFATICIHNCCTLSSNSLINDTFVGIIELWLSHKAAAAGSTKAVWLRLVQSEFLENTGEAMKDWIGSLAANRNVALMNNWYLKVDIYHG